MSRQDMFTNTSRIVRSKILQQEALHIIVIKERQCVHQFRNLSNSLRLSSQPT